MITERLRAAVDKAAQLPSEAQNQLAVALEEVLQRVAPTTSTTSTAPSAPAMAPDVQAAFEQVLNEHAATLTYLKSR